MTIIISPLRAACPQNQYIEKNVVSDPLKKISLMATLVLLLYFGLFISF